MSYTSNLAAIRAQLAEAERQGLEAGARILQGAVSRQLELGYTSGAFVTGDVAHSVRVSPVDLGTINGAIWVYSEDKKALYFEVGHFNIFRRRFTRVPVWMPALLENRRAIADAFQAAARRALAT